MRIRVIADVSMPNIIECIFILGTLCLVLYEVQTMMMSSGSTFFGVENQLSSWRMHSIITNHYNEPIYI